MKTMITKALMRTIAGLALTVFSGCVYVVDNTPGPPGHPGDTYFGVDYEYAPPYSYWDNNSSIPYNPVLGAYYFTYPAVYDFEYFVNPHEYWYGTYEIWVNAGGPGGPHGEPGYDGADTYLMLMCDPYGPHEHRGNFKTAEVSQEPVVIEKRQGNQQYRIVMQKTTVSQRPAQQPKYKQE